MPPVLLDRYLVINANQACDLATGNVVAIDGLSERREAHVPPPPALTEVLEHGRDGEPRALTADLGSSAWRSVADRIATDAVDRGYVPIAVDLYRRMMLVISGEISDRTLLLLATEHNAALARQAFLDAASRTPRPHVLLTLRARDGAVQHVREARPTYTVARPGAAPAVPHDVLQHLQRARRAAEFVAAGRHAAAERLLRDVSAALIRRRATSHAVPIAVALGRLLLERGRPGDAARTFGEAASMAMAGGEERREVEARIWLAAAKTDAAQLTAAESICRALLQVARLPNALHHWATAVLVRVLLWQGRVHDALALPAVRAPEAELDPETAAFTEATAVRLLLASGRLFDAGVRVGRVEGLWVGTPLARAIGLTSRLRVLTAAGDLTGAESTLRDIAAAAKEARAPLRLMRARLIWADALRRGGRTKEADRQWRALTRAARAAPPLLRDGVTRAASADTGGTHAGPALAEAADVDASPAALVRIAQEEGDDNAAVVRLLVTSARRLHATRLDIWSADAGPPSIVLSAGTGLASTIGSRVIDAGIAIGPERVDSTLQIGLPIRIGSRLVAAIAARWPADRAPSLDAAALLEMVAAVAAPRVDASLHRARTEAEAATLIPELVGISRAIAEVRQAVARAAAAPFSVLVEGESGVGKELIARAVHYLSPRRERRFCDVNCAALPDDLLESELFGHAKGAFTGAVVDRAGLFEEAHGGTLFLDEVADLSLRAQAKLLRVLQQQEIRRVGETFVRPVDVRLVAAANRDMRAEAAAGRFRQDLLYRVDVIRIDVPSLRDRPEDIPVLAQHFWGGAADRVGTLASFSPGVLTALASYHWPGNVRELQNVVAGLAVAAPRRGRVPADLLPAVITGVTPLRTTRIADARLQFERRFVEVALARAGGNRARAARALGLSRQGLLKLMVRLGVGTG